MYADCWVDKAGEGGLAVRVDWEEDIKMILDFGLKQLDRWKAERLKNGVEINSDEENSGRPLGEGQIWTGVFTEDI